MNKKHTDKLIMDFPILFAGVHEEITQSLMPFGFMCGDGWYDLIYALSNKLSKLSPIPKAFEVKEKFGGLCFYVNGTGPEGYRTINEAEKRSMSICEECGKKGKLRDDLAWIKTLCEKHYEIKRRKKKKR